MLADCLHDAYLLYYLQWIGCTSLCTPNANIMPITVTSIDEITENIIIVFKRDTLDILSNS